MKKELKTEKETGRIEYVRAKIRIPVLDDAGEIKRIITRTIWARLIGRKDDRTILRRVQADGSATDVVELFIGQGDDITLKRARINTRYAELEIDEEE